MYTNQVLKNINHLIWKSVIYKELSLQSVINRMKHHQSQIQFVPILEQRQGSDYTN